MKERKNGGRTWNGVQEEAKDRSLWRSKRIGWGGSERRKERLDDSLSVHTTSIQILVYLGNVS